MKGTAILRQLLLLCILNVCGLLNVSAFHLSDDYNYKTTVTVNPTGAGTVYVVYNDVNNYNYGSATDHQKSYTTTVSSYSNTTSITLNATAAEGYRFVRWADNAGNTISSTNSSPNTTITHSQANGSYTDLRIFNWYTYPEQEFKFTAYFKQNGTVIAKVQNGQEGIGSAVIQEEHFQTGDNINLIATTINGSELSGWYFDHWERTDGATIDNYENSQIVVTVPDEVVTYVAVFARINTESYCFIRNKKTKQYLKLVGKSNYSNPPEGSTNGSFNGSFVMVDQSKAISDPGCVFMVKGTSNNGGLKNATLTSQKIDVGNGSNTFIVKKAIAIRPVNEGTYSLSFTGTVTSNGNARDATLYFRDNSGTPDLTILNGGDDTEWEMPILNSSNLGTEFFGAAPNPLLTKDNKYYTTMYTTFPFELQSGNAYYINDASIIPIGDEGKYRVVCQAIPDGRVPANTPVILEFDEPYASSNKILPLHPNTEITPLEGTQLLKGHVDVIHDVVVSNGHIYVLSIGQSSGVGFYKLKSGTKMTDNKAYAVLPEEAQQAAKNVIYSFGEDFEEDDVATDITLEVVLPDDKTDSTIYDLQGRRVKTPTRGVYIVNGKKFIQN